MSRFSVTRWPGTNVLYGLALALVCLFAFLLRVLGPYGNVFTGDWVRFQWFDAWYHVRLVENLVHHFPSRIVFDPYTYFPHGQDVFFAPMYDWLIGFFAWVFGAGSPSQGLLESLAAYSPAVIGALIALPVYFLGKEMFNRTVGLVAAALVMILPGQLLLRTLLGFADHHCAEVLFSTLAMLFLVLAVKSSRDRAITYDTIRKRDWATGKKPIIYTVLAGISLGAYLLTWVGGALFVFVIFAFGVVQFAIDHVKGRSTDYLAVTGIPCLLIAILLVAPSIGRYGYAGLQVQALVLGIAAFAVLSALSLLMARRNMKRACYPLGLAVLGGIGLGLLYGVAPSLLDSIWDALGVLRPAAGVTTIGEMQPLFYPGGSFSFSTVWDEFTTGFYIAFACLFVVAYIVIRQGTPDKTLLLIWSVLMLAATIGQNRFAYYYAVNVALLTAYLSWRMLALVPLAGISTTIRGATIDRSAGQPAGRDKAKASKKEKRKKAKARKQERGSLINRYPVARYAPVAVAAIALFFLLFYPSIGMAIDVSKNRSQPSEDWHTALVWMRENTPDPFGDPEYYYELYPKPAEGEEYVYPESAYGVMNWWDYGHWITQIAHRIPNANPHQQGAGEAARFFTSQDPEEASETLDSLGSKYVIIDLMMAMHEIDKESDRYGNFYAMAQWAGKDESEFFERFFNWENKDGEPETRFLYYP
jgi:oligosaccharyl transferase (archaeosortase A-associated)